MHCPVCEAPLDRALCPSCLRLIVRSPLLGALSRPRASHVSASLPIVLASVGLALVACAGWLGAARLSIPLWWMMFVQALSVLPLGLVLFFGGVLSIVTGIDRTKGHLTRGAGARLSGLGKAVGGCVLAGCAFALMQLALTGPAFLL